MQHSIENEALSIAVRHKGIELCSIKSKKTGLEYMWGAHSDVWASHAPVLFPVIGQIRKDGHVYDGKRFHLPRHGFVRNNENFSVDVQDDTICYTLESSPETRSVYPFEFKFEVCFRLSNNALTIEHNITNLSDGNMLFSLGGHPAFKCPVRDNETYSDYYLEFEEAENSATWQVGEGGLIGKETTPFFDNTKTLALDKELFKNDALVFKDLKSKRITLGSKKSDQKLSVAFDGFPYMGIWAKYGANFVCIEPWLGIADSVDSTDDFSQKEGLVTLNPKQKYTASYSITIQE